jgi:hypothetical protein
MKAFVVSVNGIRYCTIGVAGHGVISASVTLAGQDVNSGLRMLAGGYDAASNERLEWFVPAINIGDKITIEIIESDTTDAPDRSPAEPSQRK